MRQEGEGVAQDELDAVLWCRVKGGRAVQEAVLPRAEIQDNNGTRDDEYCFSSSSGMPQFKGGVVAQDGLDAVLWSCHGSAGLP